MSIEEGNKENWQVNLDIYEGPLDLLLHLINQLEIDIYDIPIAEITEQYINYMHSMNILELDIAGDYLVMAATLISIKSQMLLPRNDEFDEIEFEVDTDEDPREHLMQLLLEYKSFKELAQKLKVLEDERSFFLTKEPADLSQYQKEIPLRKGEISLDDIVHTFKKVWYEHSLRTPRPKLIEAEELTVSEKIGQIKVHFNSNKWLMFSDLLEVPSKKELVSTFLAILELIKNRELTAFQEEIYGDIYLEYQSAAGRENFEAKE